jgi:hypothetical protein
MWRGIHSHIVVPLFELTKDTVFAWNPDCQNDFDMLKQALVKTPILIRPDFTKLFYLGCRLAHAGCGSHFLTKGGKKWAGYSICKQWALICEWKSSATPLYGVLSTSGSTCTKTVFLFTQITNHWHDLPLFPMHMGEDEDGSICCKTSVFKSYIRCDPSIQM